MKITKQIRRKKTLGHQNNTEPAEVRYKWEFVGNWARYEPTSMCGYAFLPSNPLQTNQIVNQKAQGESNILIEKVKDILENFENKSNELKESKKLLEDISKVEQSEILNDESEKMLLQDSINQVQLDQDISGFLL